MLVVPFKGTDLLRTSEVQHVQEIRLKIHEDFFLKCPGDVYIVFV